MKINLLPDMFKKHVDERVSDISSVCYMSEVVIGNKDNVVLTLCAYHKTEAEKHELFAETNDICVEWSD